MKGTIMGKVKVLKVLVAICLLSIAGTGVQAEPPAKGLVGYWKFDEGKGSTAADSSRLKNSGMIFYSSLNIFLTLHGFLN